MKHHYQFFISLFTLFILIMFNPLYEGYINTQTKIANIYSDSSNNVDISNNIEYGDKWLNTDNGGSSTEFKFSDNYKFKNPIVNNEIKTNTINKADFKFFDYYWPVS